MPVGPASPDLRPIGEAYYAQIGTSFRVDVKYGDTHTFSGLPPGIVATRVVVAGDNNNYYKFEGTPTDSASPTTYTITHGNNVFDFTIYVYPRPVVTITNAPPVGTKGLFYSWQVTVSAKQHLPILPYVNPAETDATITGFTFPAGLPAGLTGSSSGLVSGTPTQFYNSDYVGSADYPAIVAVTCNSGGSGSASTPIKIKQATPTVTNTGTAPGEDLVAFTFQITTLAGDAPITLYGASGPTTYSVDGLPTGLTLNTGTGAITGTPAVGAGGPSDNIWPVSLTATNVAGIGAPVVIPFIIVPHRAPEIFSSLSVTGILNQAFTYQIEARFVPTSYSATGLPPGLSISPVTGLITGSPTAFASGPTYIYSVSITATNAYGSDTETLEILVTFPPVALSPLSDETDGLVGTAFSYTIPVPVIELPPHPPATPFSSDSVLPPGLSLDSTTGEISGTPTQIGAYSLSIFVDNAGLFGLVPSFQPPSIFALEIFIYAAPPVPTSISPGADYSGHSATVTGTGFIGGPNAKVFFGNSEYPFIEATDVIFVNSTTITLTQHVVPSTIPYDVIVVNEDGQIGVLPGVFTGVFDGALTIKTPRLTSLDTNFLPIYDASNKTATGASADRVSSLGTNDEILFYSGRDIGGSKILNVYRKQMGTTSTRHGPDDLVFKGMLGIQISPVMEKTSIDQADAIHCLLRSNGRIDMDVSKLAVDESNVTDTAYTEWKAMLIRSLPPIAPLDLGGLI